MNQDAIQSFVDGLNASWQRERAEHQMTLGKLIEALEAMPDGCTVRNLSWPKSYRGYYTDIAFDLDDGFVPALELLALAKSCLGEVFQGYKGGDYAMTKLTPVWIADYGCCDAKLMGFDGKGDVITEEEDL